MKRLLFLALVVVGFCGCKPATTGDAATATTQTAVKPQSTSGGGGSGDGLAPLGPNVGGITPVSSTGSIDGAGGGGVDQAAKSAAKKAAGKAGGSSLSQMGDDTGGGP